MVGLPILSNSGPPRTRLTWLVNVDFGGLVPEALLQSGLLTSMFYPCQIVLDMEELNRQHEGNNVTALLAELRQAKMMLRLKEGELEELKRKCECRSPSDCRRLAVEEQKDTDKVENERGAVALDNKRHMDMESRLTEAEARVRELEAENETLRTKLAEEVATSADA